MLQLQGKPEPFIYTVYSTIYLVNSLPKLPYIHRIYIMAIPIYVPWGSDWSTWLSLHTTRRRLWALIRWTCWASAWSQLGLGVLTAQPFIEMFRWRKTTRRVQSRCTYCLIIYDDVLVKLINHMTPRHARKRQRTRQIMLCKRLLAKQLPEDSFTNNPMIWGLGGTSPTNFNVIKDTFQFLVGTPGFCFWSSTIQGCVTPAYLLTVTHRLALAL